MLTSSLIFNASAYLVRFSRRLLVAGSFMVLCVACGVSSQTAEVAPGSIAVSTMPSVAELPASEADGAIADAGDAETALATSPFSLQLRERLNLLLGDSLLQYSQLGLCIYDLTADSMVFTSGHRQYLRPASCQKLITAVAALTTLGVDYKLSTTLSLQMPDTIVSIRAGFDPLFSSADLRAFAGALRQAGITRLRRPVVIDRSIKDTLQAGWGWCWDDENPPLSPLLYEGGEGFFDAFCRCLKAEGIDADSLTFAYGSAPRHSTPLLVRSHSLQEVLLPMQKRSDNLMAETLFYHLAAHSGKPYASRREGAKAVGKFIARVCPSEKRYQVADGSGLSLYNYTTPMILVATLRAAWRDESVFAALRPALPVMGVDGTLEKRCLHTAAQSHVWAKTGTVDGVSTLSGYALAPDNHYLAFAIMNQGLLRTREGRNFQDKVCIALTTP